MPDNHTTLRSWVSTTQAAALLDCSERTIQRRAERGTIEARKVSSESGPKWEISVELPSELRTAPAIAVDTEHAQHEQAAAIPVIAADTLPTALAIAAATARDERDVEAIADLREQNQFLRGVIEQLQRDGAETRSALRKALDNAPRELSERTDSGAQSLQTIAHENEPSKSIGDSASASQSSLQRKARVSRKPNKLREIARLIFSR